jgi:hypothetical protein
MTWGVIIGIIIFIIGITAAVDAVGQWSGIPWAIDTLIAILGCLVGFYLIVTSVDSDVLQN